MSINLKICLLIVEILFFIGIVHNIRNKCLLLKYSLLWLAGICFMIIVTIFPGILACIASIVGIELVSNLVFLLGWLILLILTFDLTIIVSDLKRKEILLIQEIGILKKEIEDERNNK